MRFLMIRTSITSIDELTDDEVVAVCRALWEDPVLTQMLGIAWAASMVTQRPVLFDNEESVSLLEERYKNLTK